MGCKPARGGRGVGCGLKLVRSLLLLTPLASPSLLPPRRLVLIPTLGVLYSDTEVARRQSKSRAEFLARLR